ncbi:MAG TPA: DUF402 domain-containing protein [Anaerolineales bacterium]|nr:DUF402 domain-containing protein [Anaerolineales bacterium]
MKKTITVVKYNPAGEEVIRYTGEVLREEGGKVILEARFNRPDMPFMGTVLKNGDRFIEVYYTDRWYNIFEIHDLADDRLKGWYCNIGRPAIWETADRLSYVDLALDLWVAPDGAQTVLDEQEFEALALDRGTARWAREAMQELQALFANQKTPDFL